MEEPLEPNYSPVNFFDPDYNTYPLFADVGRKYTILLREGDCLYIPAFYFYQYIAKAPAIPDKDGIKPSALSVNLKYPSSSALLSSFFDAIEIKILN